MKKFLSVILTAAMLLSLIIVVSVPAAAVDGMWTTLARPSAYEPDEEGNVEGPIQLGYEYTDEGFKTIDADWTDSCPFQTVMSREPVNFEDGIYMQFRIDSYDYTPGYDKWISVSFWDSPNIEQGSVDNGAGISTLIRPSQKSDDSEKCEYTNINWYINEWSNQGYSQRDDGSAIPVEDDGTCIFDVELKREDGIYALYINGCAAPNTVNNYFADVFLTGEAYIGITLHNAKTGSDIGLTILKFGTSKATATVPQGDDRKDPVNIEIEEKAPIADPSTVEPNMPAILMTGDKTNSDVSSYGAGQGDSYELNDDFSVRIIDLSGDRWTTTTWTVKGEVSYDIDDFPVMCFLTKDFCTCDDPEDCYATESCKIYLLSGEKVAPGTNNVTPEIDVCWNPIIINEGEKAGTYLYFWYDSSTELHQEIFDAEGRIQGVRLDFSYISQEAGRNVVNIEWVGFFRSIEEAEVFINSYLEIGTEDETTETTENNTENITEDATVVVTEEKTEVKTEEKTESKTEEKTEKKTEGTVEENTEKTDGKDEGKTENQTNGKGDNSSSGGCGSVIGAGAFAVIALVSACGAICFKKKDNSF